MKENLPGASGSSSPLWWTWLNPRSWFSGSAAAPAIDRHPEPETELTPTISNLTTMQNGMISKENLSQDAVAEIFSNAFFDIQVSEDEHVIKDTYRTWIRADEKGRFVKFQTLFVLEPSAKEIDILRAVNNLNVKYLMFNTFMLKDRVGFEYYYWVEGGVSPKAIVQAYKFFGSVLPDLVAELADQNVIQ